DNAKSLGSTVKKKIEKAEIIIEILKIIAIAKFNDKNNVFKKSTNKKRNDKPRILLNHILNNLPEKIIGINVKNNNNNGMISVNNNALIV
ncbi:MAG: hypothetical protein ACFFA8_14760, partial [Promethearchaeota archaeon]